MGRTAVVAIAVGLMVVTGRADVLADDTVGAVDTSRAQWHLRTDEGRTVTFTFGNPGDTPFMGDWDCDGVDTPGLYRPSDGLVYLRNSNSTGVADTRYFFGNPDDVPLAGDFDGDGCDSVSLYRPSEAKIYVINRLGSGGGGLGPAERAFVLGDPGDEPFVADVDGDGADEVGLYRPGAALVFLRHELASGAADVAYPLGNPGDAAAVGDWDGDGTATPGIVRHRTFHLPNGAFVFGTRSMTPVVGDFAIAGQGVDLDWASHRFTIAMSGDVLIHGGLMKAAARGQGTFDFTPMMAGLRPVLDHADLALCHLEVPLSPDNTDLAGYPSFHAPREVATGIAAAGYHGCSVASNHSWDRARAGVAGTLDVLDAAGLGHAGTARTRAEDGATTMYALGSAQVAHLSYTWWLNGLRLPSGEEWWVDLLDPAAVAADAARARADGADLVVVSVHWGDEYRPWPNEYQRSMATALSADPNVDVIVGHHAHVVQPVDIVNGKYVVYGLGNSVSGQVGASRQDGVVALLDVESDGTKWVVAGVRFEPTWFDLGADRIFPTTAAPAPSWLRATLDGSFRRTAATFRALGVAGVAPLAAR